MRQFVHAVLCVLVPVVSLAAHAQADDSASTTSESQFPPSFDEPFLNDVAPPRSPTMGVQPFVSDPLYDFTSARQVEPPRTHSPSQAHTHAGSEHIRDNGFLVEEAFNQEADEIQHVMNWVYQWEHADGGNARSFIYAYTMEIPLGSQDHQFSFTVPLLSARQEPPTGAAKHNGGFGDTLLTYRYQLLKSERWFWCAPRFTLVCPTGDPRARLGVGEYGYQFFLPISHYGKRFDAHFNIGYTFFPTLPSAVPPDLIELESSLQGLTVGGSLLWKPRYDLHLFVEAIAYQNQGYDGDGIPVDINQVLVNPGFRYSPYRNEWFEWVVGTSVPIGLTPDSPNVGMFLYMSLEHVFREAK